VGRIENIGGFVDCAIGLRSDHFVYFRRQHTRYRHPFSQERIEDRARLHLVAHVSSLKALDDIKVRVLKYQHAGPMWRRTEI
jgi:hypothetical protein